VSDVFEVLKADHTKVQATIGRLTGPAAAQRPVAEVREDAEALVMDESRHEAAEEMYFWPAVREKVAGGDGLADQAIKQEQEGKQILERLRKAEPGDGNFEEQVAAFAAAGRDHIAFEEQEVWPKLQAALSAEEREELGRKIETAEEAGPTRPHPNTPGNPSVLKTAGTAAAVTDKLRDAVQGRGK